MPINLQYAKAPRRYSKTTIKPMASERLRVEKSNTQAEHLPTTPKKHTSTTNTLPSENQLTHMDTLPDPVKDLFN